MRVLTSQNAGGVMFRRLPWVPLVLLAIGSLALAGAHVGLYGVGFALALMLVGAIAVIAECVESEEVLQELRTIGIDFAQGYMIHKPGPLEQLRGSTRQIQGPRAHSVLRRA